MARGSAADLLARHDAFPAIADIAVATRSCRNRRRLQHAEEIFHAAVSHRRYCPRANLVIRFERVGMKTVVVRYANLELA